MFFKAVIAQIKIMIKQKEAIITFLILLIMCLSNFVGNVLDFQGYDVIEMYHPMKLLLLSYNRVYYNADATLFFVQLYPILVTCPAGFALVKEQHARQEVLIIIRVGKVTYRLSKVFAAFITATIVFVVPFLIEILLNCLAFPLDAMGDFSNRGFYNDEYNYMVNNYFLGELFVEAPYLYAFLFTIFFSVISGILSAFTMSISAIVRVKYQILLFLPVFLLLNSTLYIGDLFQSTYSVEVSWYNYLLIFNDESKSVWLLIIGILLLLVFSFGAVFCSSNKEILE